MMIEIVNWTKYNPRSDVKATSWFRLENDFWSDPVIFMCDNDQKMVWLSLLSLASQRMSGTFELEPEFVATVLRIGSDRVKETLKYLEEKGKIRHADVTPTSRPRDVRETQATRPRSATNGTDEQDETLNTPPIVPQSPRSLDDPPPKRISRAEQRAIDHARTERGSVAWLAADRVFAAAATVDDPDGAYSSSVYRALTATEKRILGAIYGPDAWGSLLLALKRHRKTRSPDAKFAENLRTQFLALAQARSDLLDAGDPGGYENSQQEASP